MQPKSETRRNPAQPLVLLVAALLAGLLLPGAQSRAQAKKPISKEGLVKAVRINGLSTAELVEQIRQRGVAFEMTPDAEAELRATGARPEVIEAARQSYRPAALSANPGGGPKSNVPPGPPLDKGQVVTMLQAGTPVARVEQFVNARGVSFRVNRQVASEITAAGGTRSLIGAITIAYTAPGTKRRAPAAKGAPPAPVVARGPDYDDLTDEATAAYERKEAARAIELLQRAIQMDPSQPRAYQLLGFTELYLQNDLAAAERNMRAAIERGGSAAFRVFHDHSEGSFKQTCAGTLFVTKTDVTFKADDGRDTFEARDSAIREIKVNRFIGANPFGALLGGKGDLGAFHIKVTKNYNFAPLTKKKQESELIIALVKSYGGLSD